MSDNEALEERVERLSMELETVKLDYDVQKELAVRARNETIEECARIADKVQAWGVAAEIRALKEKT